MPTQQEFRSIQTTGFWLGTAIAASKDARPAASAGAGVASVGRLLGLASFLLAPVHFLSRAARAKATA